MNNIFTEEGAQGVIDRINRLQPGDTGRWGKMSLPQMLAHCNVTYEMVFEPEKHPKPGFMVRLLLQAFVKGKVVSETPYKQNNPTAPQFIIKDDKDFSKERDRLVGHIRRTQELGEKHFDGLESASFGRLDKRQWNNMFYKHLDHHLKQFGQ